MTPDEILGSIREMLAPLAKKTTMYENDTHAYDASGGNYDDAYELGREDGEVVLARDILELIDRLEKKEAKP